MHEIISTIVINKINAELESERLRAKIRVDMARRTGEKRDASGLKTLGGALSLVGGAVALKAPLLQARLAGGAVALGGGALTLSADLIEQMDKLEYSVGSLSEVLETYRKNLATIAEMGQRAEGPKTTEQGKVIVPAELRKTQEIAEWGNEAVVTGLAATWVGLAGQLNALRKFGGKMVDPSAERGIIREIEAVRDALGEILNMANDPRAARLLSRMQGFLGRNAPAGPFFDEGGEPRADERIRPLSLGRRSGFSGGSGDDVLFGGSGSDTLGEPLLRLGGNAEAAAQGFAKLTEQAKRFEALTGPLATGLAETNTLFGTQAERLRGLGGLLPELGRQLVDVFDSGTVGAERLDAAVQAVGDRFLDAFEGAIARGESLGDVLKSLGRDLANLALNEVKTKGIGGIFDILGGLFTSTVLPAAGSQSGPRKGAKGLVFTNARLASFARGNAFDMGARLDRFAKGNAFTNSIVNRPTLFPMASGAGLMGEAGPEAVLPLTRLANGELGVQTPAPAATVAGPVITYNIDARGADREGLSRLAAVVREQGATINYINRTLERRAVEAVVYTRGRGGNIARAFGGW